MNDKTVKDIMIPLTNYAVVGPDASLREAVIVLRQSYCELDRGICTEAGPRTVLVANEDNELLGILDFKAILKTLIPEVAGRLSEKLRSLGISIAFAEEGAPELDESHAEFVARVRKNAEVRVRDIMLKVKGTIDADASLLDALRLIFKNKITKLPVYEGGQLVGVVRDTDLFLAVADILAES